MTTTKDEAIKTLRDAAIFAANNFKYPFQASAALSAALAATSHIAPDAAIEPPKYDYGPDGKGPVTFLNPISPRDAAAIQATGLPERDTTKPAEQQGLFRKFDVRRVDGSDQPGGKHYGCRYYVLDLDHDAHAPAAMRAYAADCADTHPQLSADIAKDFPAIAPEASELPPLPKPDTHCYDEDTKKDVWSYSGEQMDDHARAAIAMHQSVSDNRAAAEPVPTDLSIRLRGYAQGKYDGAIAYSTIMSQAADEIDRLATKPAASEAVGVLTDEVLEAIAASWDGCMYDAVGENLDIGAQLRLAFSEGSAPAAPTDARFNNVWNDALEEAAKLVENLACGEDPLAPEEVRDAIRELKSSPQAPKTEGAGNEHRNRRQTRPGHARSARVRRGPGVLLGI